MTADGGTTPKVHDGWMWDLTVPGNNDHDFYVLPADEDGNSPVLVHNEDGCPVISAAAREHVLNGVITKDGTFAGWHLHPDQTGGIPAGRFLRGQMVTLPNGIVKVDGFVGAIMDDGTLIAKPATVGHTFFPADWTADDIMAAGEDLFANGKYKWGGTLVQGPFRGVNMTGFLEQLPDGGYTPSTFFPRK